MGQVGLHALTGLVVGSYMLNHRVQVDRLARRALMFSFVVGNLIPDLDYLAVAAVFPVDQAMALHLHRGFTHSLLAAVALAVGFWIASIIMRDEYTRYLGYGLALGTAAHFLEDIFIWFSPVDIFWPASVYGLIPPINLWSWWTTPLLAGRLLGAAEFGAFALYYSHLARLARYFETDSYMIEPAERLAAFCWVTWLLLTALAFEVPATDYELAFYIPMGLVFMPACMYVTWRMQTTIEFLGVYQRQLP